MQSIIKRAHCLIKTANNSNAYSLNILFAPCTYISLNMHNQKSMTTTNNNNNNNNSSSKTNTHPARSGYRNSFSGNDQTSSYQSVISKISGSTSVQDVLSVTSQNDAILKNEHIVLALRMIARQIKVYNFNEIQSFQKDDRYLKLTAKAAESIETLNEYESLDLLFWMRKFRIHRLNINIKEDRIEKFFQRLDDFLRGKSFNFRNLVNLYYDYTFFGRMCDEACVELIKELKNDPQHLTPFSAIQLLGACSRRGSSKTHKELLLADQVIRNLNSIIEDLDNDQKTQLFKFISGIDFPYNPPRYRVPVILFTIRTQIKDKLDTLSEMSIINIIQAYEHLPREFPGDLLDEIKEMVVVTVQHNPKGIKSFFLIEFIEEMVGLFQRRRFDEKQLTSLAQEIARRINAGDEYITKPKIIERIVLNIYDRGLKNDQLLTALTNCYLNISTKYEDASSSSSEKKKPFFNAEILEFFLKKKIPDFEKLLEPFLSKRENIGSINPGHAVRLYLLLQSDSLKNHKEISDALEPKVNEIINAEPIRTLHLLCSSQIYSEQRKVLVLKAIENVMKSPILGKQGQISDNNFYKSMLSSCENKESRALWNKWMSENKAIVDFNQVIDSFFHLENFTVDNFLFLLSILTEEHANPNILRKILHYLRESTQVLYEMHRYQNLFKRLFINLIAMSEKFPEAIRLQYVYIIALRLENVSIESQTFDQFMYQSYEIYNKFRISSEAASTAQAVEGQEPAKKFNRGSNQLELLYSIKLIDSSRLSSEAAKTLLANQRDYMDLKTKSKVICYIIYRDNLSDEGKIKEMVGDTYTQIKNALLLGGGFTKVMSLLEIVFMFPVEVIREDKELLLKSLKDILENQTNDRLMLGLLSALFPKYVRKNMDFYNVFIRELISKYISLTRKASFPETVKILDKFSSLDIKNPLLYNNILSEIGNNFATMSPDDRISCLKSFSKLKIKQPDFLLKNFQKILENNSNFKSSFSEIFRVAYRLGLDDPESFKLLSEFFEKSSITNSYDIFLYAQYLSLIKIENESQVFEKLFSQIDAQMVAKRLKRDGNQRDVCLVLEFFRRIHPNIFEKLKDIIDPKQASENLVKEFEKGNWLKINIEQFCHYLKAMKVQAEQNTLIEGIPIDVYIPSTQTLVYFARTRDTNFDRNSFSGNHVLSQRILQKLVPEGGQLIVVNTFTYNNYNDHLARVNYLVEIGIENNNTEGQYDFSQIQLQKQPDTKHEKSSSDDSSSSSDEDEAKDKSQTQTPAAEN